MKKILAILLAVCMVFAMTACGSAASPDAQPTNAVQPSSATDATADDTVYELTLGSYYAEGHVFYDWVEQFAADVLEASNGRLKINCYQNGQLGDEAELVNSVALGTLDMAIGLGPGQIGALYAPMQVFEAPYALMNKDHIDNVAKSDWGKAMFEDMEKETNLHLLSFLYQGKRFITTTNVPINTPDDLKGLKIRTPDQTIPIANFTAYGATATPMAFSEVYLALSQNVVDGQENPISQIVAAKFYEVQNYISLTGHVVQSTSMCINSDVLNSLPDDLREILINMAYEGQFTANQLMEDWEQEKLSELSSLGMTIVEPDVDAFKAISAGVVKQFESLFGEGMYEQLQSIA